eukprot:gene8904-biopygen6413
MAGIDQSANCRKDSASWAQRMTGFVRQLFGVGTPSHTATVKDFFNYMPVPALSLLIRRGELGAVLACLESPREIDFTCTTRGRTLLIYEIVLANTAGWPDYNRRVLSAVVDRVASHPKDKVDWSMKVYGMNLLSFAARYQLLSVFWPVLQSDV